MSIHEGHRARLRERFMQEGLDSFAPHEVLELLLFCSKPRGDTNPTAHTLLERFGSLRGVLEAPPEQLMKVPGVGEQSAALITMLVPMFRRYTACIAEEGMQLQTCAQAEEYCRGLLAGLRTERFYVISLSANGTILGSRLIAEGTFEAVGAYPRQVAEAVLNTNAASVILCHNHPGGDATPSQADLDVTRSLASLLSGLSVSLLDHIVTADGKTWSMARHGQLKIETEQQK